MTRLTAILLSTALFSEIVSPSSSHADGGLRTVALTGQLAPGSPPGRSFNSTLGFPVINDLGEVAFANGQAIWSEAGGEGLQLMFRIGGAAPGGQPDAFFSRINNTNRRYFSSLLWAISNNGVTATQAIFRRPGLSGERGIFRRSRSGELEALAVSGGAAPGTTASFSRTTPAEFLLNDEGEAAFLGRLNSSPNLGLWRETANEGLGLVVRSGQPAPGVAEAVFDEFEAVTINNSGQTAFAAVLDGGGFRDLFGNSIWFVDGERPPRLAALKGAQAPGLPEGYRIDRFVQNPRLNDAGQVAFRAGLSIDGSPAGEAAWVWDSDTGLARIAARSQTPAPGLPSGAEFAGVFSHVINQNGHVAFNASFFEGPSNPGGSSNGIWSEGSGEGLELVARLGGQAPGVADGVVFDQLGIVSINAQGQTFFEATLAGEGVTDLNRHGVWAQAPDGMLTLVMRQGEFIDVDDDPLTETLKQVARVSTSAGLADFGPSISTGNEDGFASSFNDRGELAFFATFTDGTSGVFVSSVVAVPEPHALASMVAVIGAAIARRRKNSAR